jgi:hypothetical protein
VRVDDVLPGCGTLSILQVKRRGLLFSSTVDDRKLLDAWGLNVDRLQIVHMPVVFLLALLRATSSNEKSVLDDAFNVFMCVDYVCVCFNASII